MHLLASPVAVINGDRFRPNFTPICPREQLDELHTILLSDPTLKTKHARIDQVFELLKRLPEDKGEIGIVDLVEAPYQTNLEVTTPLLSESKNWKVDVHAALNDFLSEFGAIKRSQLAPVLDIFMVSTTLRLLDRYTKIANGEGSVIEHSWENRMVNGGGFALLDLNSGTYLGGLDSHKSMAGYHHSRPQAGHSLFTATIFAEEGFAERWAQECAEYYPNIAIAPIQTRIENLRVVQMSSNSESIEEHLARFSKALIEQQLDPQLASKSKTARKI